MMLFFVVNLLVLFAGSYSEEVGVSGRMQGRVLLGAVPRVNQFPFLISISDSSHGSHFCGASLIKESLVLTAAHCLHETMLPGMAGELEFETSSFVLTAGEHNLSRPHEGAEQTAHVKKLVVHKDYDHVNYFNDVALIEVDTPFKSSAGVGTIKLATAGNKYLPRDCTIAGWGYTLGLTAKQWALHRKAVGIPDTLSFAKVDIIEKGKCKELHKVLKEHDLTASHASTICAGKLEGGTGTCIGDSGGPLTCQLESDPSGPPLLTGIVSAGVGCGLPNSPTLFTSVAFMEPWLKKAIEALRQEKGPLIRI